MNSDNAAFPGRVSPHSKASARRVAYFENDGEHLVIKNERYTMHLLFLPVLANVIWIGGGSVGLLLIIVVVVLLLR